MNFNRALWQAAIIALLSLTAAALHRGTLETPADKAQTNESNAALPTEIPAAAANAHSYLTLEETQAVFDADAAQFVDARKAEDYATGHIPGAINIEYVDFKANVDSLLQPLEPSSMTIIYCDEGCDASQVVAEQLALFGFSDLWIMQDGFEAWRDAGYPVEAGGTDG